MVPGYWLRDTGASPPAVSDRYACLHWKEFVSLDEEQNILYYDDALEMQAFHYE